MLVAHDLGMTKGKFMPIIIDIIIIMNTVMALSLSNKIIIILLYCYIIILLYYYIIVLLYYYNEHVFNDYLASLSPGDYVFYTIEMLPEENVLSPEDVWAGNDGRDRIAKEAFQAVFHVTILTSHLRGLNYIHDQTI